MGDDRLSARPRGRPGFRRTPLASVRPASEKKTGKAERASSPHSEVQSSPQVSRYGFHHVDRLLRQVLDRLQLKRPFLYPFHHGG